MSSQADKDRADAAFHVGMLAGTADMLDRRDEIDPRRIAVALRLTSVWIAEQYDLTVAESEARP